MLTTMLTCNLETMTPWLELQPIAIQCDLLAVSPLRKLVSDLNQSITEAVISEPQELIYIDTSFQTIREDTATE